MIESPCLDRENSTMPTYREIADAIAARIARGDWAPGAKLPTTAAFAKEYGVAEASAYRALVLLIDRGLVVGRRGSGRYVPESDKKLT